MKAADAKARSSVCLSQQPVFPFSPSAFQASLQTSILRLRNRTNGATMSILNPGDGKNRPSPPLHTKIHLCEPQSQPDATGFPEAEPVHAQPAGFVADFVAEHSSPGAVAPPSRHLPGSFHVETPTVAKSAKA